MKKLLLLLLVFGPIALSAQTESRKLVLDSVDLKIVQLADKILSDASKWNKADERECADDIVYKKYSLYCALYKASVDIAGTFEHRRPAVQQVRFVLEKYENGRVRDHRLMDWNNHVDTTFEEVKKVLKESIEVISEKLASEAAGSKK